MDRCTGDEAKRPYPARLGIKRLIASLMLVLPSLVKPLGLGEWKSQRKEGRASARGANRSIDVAPQVNLMAAFGHRGTYLAAINASAFVAPRSFTRDQPVRAAWVKRVPPSPASRSA